MKYEWNNTIWNLDDGTWYLVPLCYCSLTHMAESDCSIFAWRMKSSSPGNQGTPVLHVRNPDQPLPPPTEYRNPSYYMFYPNAAPISPRLPASPHSTSVRSGKSHKRSKETAPRDTVPKFKKEFEKFHNENGVRTVSGSIGPVNNGKPMCICSHCGA